MAQPKLWNIVEWDIVGLFGSTRETRKLSFQAMDGHINAISSHSSIIIMS
jgi:hypothetical protein